MTVSPLRARLQPAALPVALLPLLFLAQPASCTPVDGAPPIRLEVSLAHETSGPTHIFVLEVRTDLPDGATIEGALCYVKKTKEGEEQEVDLECASLPVTHGRVEFRLGHFHRDLYVGVYRGRAVVQAQAQPEAVVRRLGEDSAPIVVRADLPLGEPALLTGQKAAARECLMTDFKRLRDLFRELVPRVTRLYSLPEAQAAAWREGRDGWLARIEDLREQNKLRIEADVYWVEMYGKRYVEMLTSDLKQAERAVGDELEKPFAARRPFAQLQELNEFPLTQEMFMQNLGMNAVADAEGLASAVLSYRKLLDEVSAWIARRRAPATAKEAASEWAGRRGPLEASAQSALARLSSLAADSAFHDVARLGRDSSTLLAACAQAAAQPGDDPPALAGAARLQASMTEALERLDALAREGR
ncbi:MAG: hypothetical protein HYZ53_05390 [Planctomycetes bacterium]|nr:hypothetical protein [Planctomycetota bacterium]